MKRGQCEILDTYPDLLAYWRHARFKTVNEQIRLWQTLYMKKYPELLKKQIQNYEEENIDWQDVAKKIFPNLLQHFELMRRARENILGETETGFRHHFHHLRGHWMRGGMGNDI